MTVRSHVHIIDSDFRRRARVSRELLELNLHAEIYESVGEFSSHVPSTGMVLAADDIERFDLDDLIGVLEDSGHCLPVAMYSEQPSPERIVRAMLDGVLDYLQWPFDPALLGSAIARLRDKGEQRAEQERRRTQARTLIEMLSPREFDVLSLIVQGNANKDAAGLLGISPRTVEVHRANMMRKLNARSTSDAVRLALYAGLDEAIDCPPAAIAA